MSQSGGFLGCFCDINKFLGHKFLCQFFLIVTQVFLSRRVVLCIVQLWGFYLSNFRTVSRLQACGQVIYTV